MSLTPREFNDELRTFGGNESFDKWQFQVLAMEYSDLYDENCNNHEIVGVQKETIEALTQAYQLAVEAYNLTKEKLDEAESDFQMLNSELALVQESNADIYLGYEQLEDEIYNYKGFVKELNNKLVKYGFR